MTALTQRYEREKADRITARSLAKKERSNASRRGDRWRCVTLRKRYGITAAEFDAMSEQQGGACFICRETKDHRLVVDHCHATQRVSRLLCHRCNMIVGVIEADADRLDRAQKYVASFNNPIAQETLLGGGTIAELRGVGRDDRPVTERAKSWADAANS